MDRFSILALPSLLLASACGGDAVEGRERAASPADLARGAELFDAQCALCHGATGAGDGPASFLLFPPARDFTAGRFKLASTRNGAPTDADLERVIARGMPGSAMPGFARLGAGDVHALAVHVRALALEGLTAELGAETARARLAPGEPIAAIPPPASPDALARGAELYAARCAGCHGASGEGGGDVVLNDLDDVRNRARDLSTGFLKGGGRPEDLALRTLVGMHGTSMPASGLSNDDVGAIAAHLATLLPSDADQRGVRTRRVIRVARTAAPVPRDPHDPRWDDVEPVRIWLAPLWWSDDAVLEADVAALHDGGEITVLVRWLDATLDAPGARASDSPRDALPRYADGVALELSPAAEPPFFGMGPAGERADIWSWRAFDVDLGGLAAELRAWPHRLGEWFADPVGAEPPLLRVAFGVGASIDETGAFAAGGMSRSAESPALRTPLEVGARWSDGRWSVAFTRALAPYEPALGGEVAFAAGEDVSATFAVWNGANRDLRGRKSIATWHVLRLEK